MSVPEDIEALGKFREALIELTARLTLEDQDLLADLLEVTALLTEAHVLEERDRCAEICDEFAKENWGLTELVYAGETLAAEIRSDIQKTNPNSLPHPLAGSDEPGAVAATSALGSPISEQKP